MNFVKPQSAQREKEDNEDCKDDNNRVKVGVDGEAGAGVHGAMYRLIVVDRQIEPWVSFCERVTGWAERATGLGRSRAGLNLGIWKNLNQNDNGRPIWLARINRRQPQAQQQTHALLLASGRSDHSILLQ
mmetsp:Transcript_32487/g.95758  ORF Transcript_32487/g.95758 Transcript_32487/m.95758 type:complete len:130 (-) Transcript_32487:130-519(-)